MLTNEDSESKKIGIFSLITEFQTECDLELNCNKAANKSQPIVDQPFV